MADQSVETAPQAGRLTARGAATRDRLVRAAADRRPSEVIQHEPAFMLGVIDALVWPNLRVEIEVTAARPAS
jgi:hypothetical protein